MSEQTHVVKCWPTYFDAIERGDKAFDVRRDDRGYQKGDILELHRTRDDCLVRVEINFQGKPARMLSRRITYVLTGGQLGIEPGYVVLSLGALEHPQ